MLLRISFIFLTLVWCARTVYAAPHLDSPPAKEGEPSESTDESQFKLENMSISQPEKPSNSFSEYIAGFSKRDYYHTYQQNIHVFGGMILPFVDSTDDEDLLHYTLGVSYEFKRRDSPKWEAEAVWTTLSVGQLSAMKKHIFNEKGSFRPFYRYGVTYKVVPEEKLASAANFENFLGRVGIGFEDILSPPKSLRFDLDAAVGAEDMWLMLFVGYVWGW